MREPGLWMLYPTPEASVSGFFFFFFLVQCLQEGGEEGRTRERAWGSAMTTWGGGWGREDCETTTPLLHYQSDTMHSHTSNTLPHHSHITDTLLLLYNHTALITLLPCHWYNGTAVLPSHCHYITTLPLLPLHWTWTTISLPNYWLTITNATLSRYCHYITTLLTYYQTIANRNTAIPLLLIITQLLPYLHYRNSATLLLTFITSLITLLPYEYYQNIAALPSLPWLTGLKAPTN